MEHDRDLRKSNYIIIPAIVLLMSFGLIFLGLHLYRDSESDRPPLRHVFVHCFPSSFKRQSLWNSDTADVIRHIVGCPTKDFCEFALTELHTPV